MKPSSVLLTMLLMAGIPFPAIAGQVVCDDNVVRLSRALAYDMLSPEAAKRAQEQLLKTLDGCKPVFNNSTENLLGESPKPQTLERKGPKPPVPPTPPKRPRGSGSSPSPDVRPDMVDPMGSGPDVNLERQLLQNSSGRLSPTDMRESERRLDAIERQAERNPAQADSMMRIYQQDQSLSNINRSTAPAAPSSSFSKPSPLGPVGSPSTAPQSLLGVPSLLKPSGTVGGRP